MCPGMIWAELVLLSDPGELKPGIKDHRTVGQISVSSLTSFLRGKRIWPHVNAETFSLSFRPLRSIDWRVFAVKSSGETQTCG